MILFLEKTANNLGRNLKNINVAFRIYGIIFAFCVYAFLFRGIIPLYSLIRTKIDLSAEMQKDQTILEKNLEFQKQAEIDLKDNAAGIKLLDVYMPVDTNTQAYMLDFIQTVGSQGFDVKNFEQTVNKAQPGTTDLQVVLESTTFPPTNLIKMIEKIKRVTQINNVNLRQNNSGETSINMDMIIYNSIL